MKKTKVLELFSGTATVSKECMLRGYHVTTLDILPCGISDVHIQEDIMTWNYTLIKPNTFDFIWASPPCTEYTSIKNISKKPRDLVKADGYVLKTLDIIKYFKPTYWIIENPQSGILKSRPMMKHITYDDVDYCKYGFPYRKRTRLWNNIIGLDIKMCKYDCLVSDHKLRRHDNGIGKTRQWNKDNSKVSLNTSQLGSIPSLLVKSILNQLPYWRQLVLKQKIDSF